MIEIIRIFASVILGCVSAFIAIELVCGKCLGLVFKPDTHARHEQQLQEHTAREIGKLASAVAFSFFAADASLLFFELGRTLDVPVMQQVFSMVCNVAMIAFLITVVRLFAKLNGTKDPKAKFKSSNVRVTAFVMVLCIILTIIAVLF